MVATAGERMYAHGGIVVAAASVLQDMDQHKLLQRLLEEYDPYDQQHLQPHNRSGCLSCSMSVWICFWCLVSLKYASV